ncbi:energy transducer TonB [Rhodobacteraceae bacterium F11138]|nr:energy transducer TonB [Rhodobacteraceae bacterium F11138]
MIPRSAAIAIAALLVSVLLHALGLSFVPHRPPDNEPEQAGVDAVALSNTFEDVVELQPEAAPPDAAPVPEPPVQTPPEPEVVNPETSEALVASSDPQDVLAPDRPAEEVQPGAAPSPPVAPAPEPEPSQESAALPAAQAPAPPIPSAPEVPEITNEISPVTPDTVAPGGSDLAVAASPRPRLPERTASPGPAEPDDGPTEFADLRSPPLMESPLAAYQRNRTDLITPQNGGSDFLGSGGSGNASVTNYAGRVLVHLNRAPSVRISMRGAAWVHFVINPDGSLARVDIIDSTGSFEIEQAAREQVRKAAPFPRPPDGTRKTLTFVYRKN